MFGSTVIRTNDICTNVWIKSVGGFNRMRNLDSAHLEHTHAHPHSHTQATSTRKACLHLINLLFQIREKGVQYLLSQVLMAVAESPVPVISHYGDLVEDLEIEFTSTNITNKRTYVFTIMNGVFRLRLLFVLFFSHVSSTGCGVATAYLCLHLSKLCVFVLFVCEAC